MSLPVAVHELPVDTVQVMSKLLDMVPLPGVPMRSVTVIVELCSEKTYSFVATQPFGTHVNAALVAYSVVLPFELFTEKKG